MLATFLSFLFYETTILMLSEGFVCVCQIAPRTSNEIEDESHGEKLMAINKIFDYCKLGVKYSG